MRGGSWAVAGARAHEAKQLRPQPLRLVAPHGEPELGAAVVVVPSLVGGAEALFLGATQRRQHLGLAHPPLAPASASAALPLHSEQVQR